MRSQKLGTIALLLLFTATCIAQSENKQSYDVELRVFLGSDRAGPSNSLPTDLEPFTRKLTAQFGQKHLSPAGLFHARVLDGGTVENRSMTSFSLASFESTPIITNWRFSNITEVIDASNRTITGAFRFNANVPIRTAVTPDGKSQFVVNYEQISLSINQIAINGQGPTFVGSLNLPGSGDVVFLFLSVSVADLQK